MKKDIKSYIKYIDRFISYSGYTAIARYTTLVFTAFMSINSLYAQKSESELYKAFEEHFNLMDSLIFKAKETPYTVAIQEDKTSEAGEVFAHRQDSLSQKKVQAQIKAMRAQTGLVISGNTYYRVNDGTAPDPDQDDAISGYKNKVQAEVRWNFLNSSLISRASRTRYIELQGEIERLAFHHEQTKLLIDEQKKLLRVEYDSLLSGVLQLRINNLHLLQDAQSYLVSDRSISTDELLDIMDDAAVASRRLSAIPRDYPIASQLSRPTAAIIEIDTTALINHIRENESEIIKIDLQSRLLREKEKSTSYWRELNVSPFVRYSHYTRKAMPNYSNVDAGLSFQIPISSQSSKERKAIQAERIELLDKKDAHLYSINVEINAILEDIERANRGLGSEISRILTMKNYIEMRKGNYSGHIGQYNFLSRIKEYNHYLECWENYLSYLYERDSLIIELQSFLYCKSILDFCKIEQ
ncbi:MAG: hypothetical protein IIY15_06575 [Flavobacteriales bacterium]|nr:hypothetical protein [Flavobacteriales bacterium]